MLRSGMLRAESAFSFACGACGRCCHNQAIQLNAFEILHLARGLELSTTSLLARHTDNGGLFLRFGNRGACDFLQEQGCRVHAHRPLACRLYPLGLEESPVGRERYSRLRKHPHCAGRVGKRGRLVDFLAGQGAAEFVDFSRRYARLAEELWNGLQAVENPRRRLELTGRLAGRHDPVWQWLDADRALARWLGVAPPADPAGAAELHLAHLARWLKEGLA